MFCNKYFVISEYLYMYVIVWVTGINYASNAGRKLVIVQGTANHYYCFLPALRVQLIPNTTGFLIEQGNEQVL